MDSEPMTQTSPLRRKRYFVNLQACTLYIYVTSSLTILSITLMMNYDYFHLDHYCHTLFIIVFMVVMRYNQTTIYDFMYTSWL